MEVATTTATANNRQLGGESDATTAGAVSGAHSPFQREVREWQRIDPETGALLSGRLEADRWINGPHNSYGKISDSQNISQPNGTQQMQRKQLEVLQSCTANGGAMQVIRAQTTIHSKSSSNVAARWSSTSTTTTATKRTSAQNAISPAIASTAAYNGGMNGVNGVNGTNGVSHHNGHNASSNSNSDNDDDDDDDDDVDVEHDDDAHHRYRAHTHKAPQQRQSHSDNWPTLRHANGNGSVAIAEVNGSSDNSDIDGHAVERFNYYNNNNNQQHHHNSNGSNDNGNKMLLLQTTPSLKLSNLMKSTSSIASNNSSNSSITTTTTTPTSISTTKMASHGSSSTNTSTTSNNNTHKSLSGKISLHAIVGSNNNNNNKKNNSNDKSLTTRKPTTTAAKSTQWRQQQQQQQQQRNNHLYEQAAIYGKTSSHNHSHSPSPSNTTANSKTSNGNGNSKNNNNINNTKRVGVNGDIGIGIGERDVGISDAAAAVTYNTRAAYQQQQHHYDEEKNVEMTPTQQQHHHQHHHHQQQQQHHHDLESFRHYNEPTTTTTTTTITPNTTRKLTTTTRFNANSVADGVGLRGRVSGIGMSNEHVQHNDARHDDDDDDNDEVADQHDRGDGDHDDDVNVGNGVDLRLSARHQRRQQMPQYNNNNSNNSMYGSGLVRARSISTDDLSSNDWWSNNNGKHNMNNPITGAAVDDAEEDDTPTDWRRVSKLRRSFQSTSTSGGGGSGGNSNNTSEYYKYSLAPRRPIDLPHNTVSVAKIRADLESGRRLNTAMRNNRVDLAALDTLLKDVSEAAAAATAVKHTSITERGSGGGGGGSGSGSGFLTAASLQEIRGKLKKLSDESLYKDDFIMTATAGYGDGSPPPPAIDEEVLEVASSVSVSRPKSAFQSVVGRRVTTTPAGTFHMPQRSTNSLETRQKYGREAAAAAEWHLRRKSYGFEKMSPPSDKSMARMDASTDSGLGRSGEQLGNWSPTSEGAANAAANTRGGTVIHFGSAVSGSYRLKSRLPNSPSQADELKRHSFAASASSAALMTVTSAIDETQFVRENLRKTSQVRLSGLYDEESNGSAPGEHFNRQKRVEFCKTEVHFAAESGRVNIVETAGKPPPTQNFRRRRRTTTTSTTASTSSASSTIAGSVTAGASAEQPLQTLVKSASASTAPHTAQLLPIMHFGDEQSQLTNGSSSSSSGGSNAVAAVTTATTQSVSTHGTSTATANTITNNALYAHESSGSGSGGGGGSSYIVTAPSKPNDASNNNNRHSYTSTSGIDTTDGETTDEISAIRGILKNKPIKPKPYHLGENIPSHTLDTLWPQQQQLSIGGVGSTSKKASEVMTSSVTGVASMSGVPPPSVAERVRIVEGKRLELTAANGYSTKINLSLGETTGEPNATTTTTTTIYQNNTNPLPIVTLPHHVHHRPTAQELMLQDLREHQRMLDEGLKSTSLIMRTMRSANEFDAAMRRLSIASMEAAAATVIAPIVVPTVMLRSHSYQDTTNAMRRNSTLSTTTTTTATSTSSSSSSFDYQHKDVSDSHPLMKSSSWDTQPMAAPRLKLLGNTNVPVSQQLTQLRRLYAQQTSSECGDGGGGDDIDSADEEVSAYFRSVCATPLAPLPSHPPQRLDSSDSGGGTQESSSMDDERGSEYSGSWSRMKARRTIWKIEATASTTATNQSTTKERTLRRAELPKSNVMNIELHSPQTTLPNAIAAKPLAKPRTTTSELKTSATEHAALKIVKEARGARKLRDHELSYFGVPVVKHENEEIISTNTTATKAIKRNLPEYTMITNTLNDLQTTLEKQKQQQYQTTTTTTKWQLLNDKPDLLLHSPITAAPRKSKHQPLPNGSGGEEEELDEHDVESDEQHYYENIANELKAPVFKVKTPTAAYERKKDLQRDAMILDEMTHNADQTLKAISDEAALKDQRRRSLHRRSNSASKPLETIDEQHTINAQRINDKCIAVKLNRSTFASEAKRNSRSRHATPSPAGSNRERSSDRAHSGDRHRSSSQSSVEASCPRARSHSLSSGDNDYEPVSARASGRRSASTSNAHGKSRRHTTGSGGSTQISSGATVNPSSRSSSRDSQHSCRSMPHGSSGDEEVTQRRHRDDERARSKVKRSSHSHSQQQQQQQHHRHRVEKAVAPSSSSHRSTTHSSQREHVECKKTDHHHHHHSHHQHHLQRGGESSSSSCRCRQRDARDTREHQSSSGTKRSNAASGGTVGSSGSMERREKHHSTRSAHEHHHRSATTQGKGDKEKEKLTRSKGHSSRSSANIAATTGKHGKKSSTASSAADAKTSSKSQHDATTTTKTMTHGKAAPLLNGHNESQQHNTSSHHNGLPHIQHSLTTATITAKQRGKDRK